MKQQRVILAPELRIYTAAEVCNILKIGQRTLYRYIADGKITGFRTGRQYRFTEDDLKAFISRQQGKRPYNKTSDYWEQFSPAE